MYAEFVVHYWYSRVCRFGTNWLHKAKPRFQFRQPAIFVYLQWKTRRLGAVSETVFEPRKVDTALMCPFRSTPLLTESEEPSYELDASLFVMFFMFLFGKNLLLFECHLG